jgi:hypothetical protein
MTAIRKNLEGKWAVIKTAGLNKGAIKSLHGSWQAAERACPATFYGTFKLDAKGHSLPALRAQ